MTSAVENALAAAREQAAANTAAGLPAASNTNTNTYAAPTVATGRHLPSVMDTLNDGGLTVDEWVKVTGDGIKLGNGKVTDELEVEIDFEDVAVVYSARGEIAGQVAYAKSRDLVTAVDGRHWGQALQDLQQGNPAKFTGQYTTYEIPMTLLKDYSKDVQAGSTVGYQPAVMGAKEVQRFLKKAPEDLIQRGPVRVLLTHKPMTKGTNSYGVITFTLLDA